MSGEGSENPRRAAFRAWLAANGLRVLWVARRSGVRHSTLYSFLSGQTQSLKASTEAKVAQAYETSCDAVFGAAGAGAEPACAEVADLLAAWARIAPGDRPQALAVIRALAAGP